MNDKVYLALEDKTMYTGTSEIKTIKTPQSKNSCLSFYYPSQKGEWTWDWWFNYDGGIKSWLYKKWEVINKDKTNKWSARIILGFKRIDREWLVSPEEALKEHYKGVERLVEFLLDLVKEPINDKDDIEETRLFK